MKKSFTNAILVDAGDHLQGTAYGGMDKGATMIQLMNAAGYDAATLGNHEFDYGMLNCFAAMEAADYPYISCNFHNEEKGVVGDTVLNAYVILEACGKKLAFVGITTPETIQSTTPAYFQNEAGEYIYGILGGEDGGALYTAVQSAIDAAKEEGADYIIALGHLGVDLSSGAWTSRNVIANTSGLDAFIDGHSHTTIEMEEVADLEGNQVILTQTGSYLNAVGKLTISSTGEISTELLSGEDLSELVPDATVKELEDSWISEINEKLGEVIGYSEVILDNFDENGNRLVRKQETNSGDFSADALYYLFDEMDMDVDAAIMNGGGVRNEAVTGELSYLDCKEIHTFGNVACLLTVTGQQLLDVLEWGVSKLAADGSMEDGTFMHVSGLRFTVDLSIPSTVQSDDKGIWTGGPTGEYRVQNVEILNNETDTYETLVLDAEYNLAGYNYTLRDLGGGCAMFEGAKNVLDYVAEDYMVLANYVQSFPVDEESGLPTITTESSYDNLYGDGRITIIGATYEVIKPVVNESADSPKNDSSKKEAADYVVEAGDCLWSIAKKYYGSGTYWNLIYEANTENISSPERIQIGQVLQLP